MSEQCEEGTAFSAGLFIGILLMMIALGISVTVQGQNAWGSVQFRTGVVIEQRATDHSLLVANCTSDAPCKEPRVWVCPKLWPRFRIGSFFDERAWIRGEYGDCRTGGN